MVEGWMNEGQRLLHVARVMWDPVQKLVPILEV